VYSSRLVASTILSIVVLLAIGQGWIVTSALFEHDLLASAVGGTDYCETKGYDGSTNWSCFKYGSEKNDNCDETWCRKTVVFALYGCEVIQTVPEWDCEMTLDPWQSFGEHTFWDQATCSTNESTVQLSTLFSFCIGCDAAKCTQEEVIGTSCMSEDCSDGGRQVLIVNGWGLPVTCD
jgi:hypothetical protein